MPGGKGALGLYPREASCPEGATNGAFVWYYNYRHYYQAQLGGLGEGERKAFLMFADRWLRGERIVITSGVIEKALNELEEETEKIRHLAEAGKYWDAYVRLITCVSFLNIAGQQLPSKWPDIIGRLLDWIRKIKGEVDKIVRGLGGNGYSIGASLPLGVSVSISFPA